MRVITCLVVFFTLTLPSFGQTAASTGPGLPKEPSEIFAAAAPFYDFTDAALKPWHLKATYQLYDEIGKPTEQGTYEYWWASPQVYRSTWTRPSAMHTDWHTEDGKYAYESAGEPMNLFEYNLQTALLSPLPSASDLDPAKFRLDDEGVATNGASGPCFTIVPRMKHDDSLSYPNHGPFPTYCFELQRPVLRSVYSFERVITQFNNIVKTQGKFLAQEVNIAEGKHKLLTAKVDRIDPISSSDPALTPSSTATYTDLTYTGLEKISKVEIENDVAVGILIKKVNPIYPREAKKERIQGNVVLVATIGTDGKIHDLRVVSAPSALLANSAFQSVLQWEYKPYLLKGQPVPVETTINVKFALG